jgi:hypothetical protein
LSCEHREYLPVIHRSLHDLVNKIDGSLAQKEFALGVFLDVEGAFDKTSYELMNDVPWRAIMVSVQLEIDE